MTIVDLVSKISSNLGGIYRTAGPLTFAKYLSAIAISAVEIMRTRTLVPADARMGGTYTYALQGTNVSLAGKYFSGAREMYCRQVYFPTDQYQLRPGDTVVDLGANAGLFSLLAGRAGCRVVAVEAQSGFVREIRSLAQEQGVADQIVAECALIGGATGVLADANALRNASHFAGIEPQRIGMSDLIAKHRLTKINFLKIDIEGSEFDLFSGSCPWLACVTKIAMEVHGAFGNPSVLIER